MKKSSGKQVGVSVFCRFRPTDVDKHLKVSENHKFEIVNGKSVVLNKSGGIDHLFHLDVIFKDSTTQEEMFEHVGQPIVRDVLHGYNGTIFAYGQTGSGKTHSLFGDMSNAESVHRGIIPRACEQIFEHIERAEDIEEVTIRCSFVEIYMEKLQDLLMPNHGKLRIRENADKTITVQNIHEEYVGSFSDVFDLLQIGFRNRVVASTLMNQQSSRSHCVLMLNIKQTMKGGTVKTSKVNFADLAGSEKTKKTGAKGAVLDQAKAINLSLSALGNVINALTTRKKGRHVPYRDSKLTFLLQDALGGNTKTSLVITCSSEKYNFDETVNTLRFASRAKQMKNKVAVNKQVSAAELQVMIGAYKKKLGVANATILRLQKLITLMRSPSYNDEQYGAQIDMYLSELSKIQEVENQISHKDKDTGDAQPASKQQQQQQKQRGSDQNKADTKASSGGGKAEAKVDDDDEDAPQLDSSSSSSTDKNAADMEAISIMENLHATIGAKDKLIEILNEEIRELKQKDYSQSEQIKGQQEDIVRMSSMSAHALKINRSELPPVAEMAEEELSDSVTVERTLQQELEEQMKAMEALRLEKDEIDRDRRQLLLWNQELQKRLDAIQPAHAADGHFKMPSAELAAMHGKVDQKRRVSERFEHQLSSLRKVLSHNAGSRSGSGSLNDELEIIKDIKHKLDDVADHGSDISGISDLSDLVDEAVDHRRESAAQIHEHKVRAQQTAMIMYNLQNKLSKLPSLNKDESRDLVDAAITSIRCLLDSSSRLTADTDNLKSQRRLTDDEVAEIDGLKGENQKLIKKLADMKTTWIAHLDMLMAPHSAVLDEEDMDDMRVSNVASLSSLSVAVDSERPSRQSQGKRQSIFTKFGRKSKSNKVIKPIHRQSVVVGPQSGLKKMIGYLSGALLQYFGQVAVLRGPLLMCNKRVSLIDFHIDDEDWKKVYVVLTKTELLGYRSLLHAETDTKSPLFQVALSAVVSVLRIEEVLSALTITSPSNSSSFDKTGMYIISTVDKKFVFKAEGNLSREVWMDNVSSLLSD